MTDSNITGSAKWGVFIYQSMSGDSSVGVGTFDMTGGSLTNNTSGPVFMVLNTEAAINPQDVDISTSAHVLIRATDASDGDAQVDLWRQVLEQDSESVMDGSGLDQVKVIEDQDDLLGEGGKLVDHRG